MLYVELSTYTTPTKERLQGLPEVIGICNVDDVVYRLSGLEKASRWRGANQSDNGD